MRQLWKAAREKERRKARYCIRQRVLVNDGSGNEKGASIEIDDNNDANPFDFHGSGGDPYKEQQQEQEQLSSDEISQVEQILKMIAIGKRSYFSVSFLATNFDLLNKTIPVKLLLEYLPGERLISRFGSNYFVRVQTYLKSYVALTFMEYSILVGRYHIVSGLLIGGINPCCRGILVSNQSNQSVSSKKLTRVKQGRDEIVQDLQLTSCRVLRRFFDCFPLSLSAYIVKRCVDFRLQSFLTMNTTCDDQHFICELCREQYPSDFRLVFVEDDNKESSSGCGCSFCQACYWNDILQNIDGRVNDADVVKCPCCGMCCPKLSNNVNFTSLGGKSNFGSASPQERCEESKKKFYALPVDPLALKRNSKHKRKQVHESDAIVSSWGKAVLPSLGLCQSVRKEKLFTFTEKGGVPYVKGCLRAGIDVDLKNEYGQTPLYLATWRGNRSLVEALLAYGANPWVEANGGLTLDGLCHAHGNVQVLDIIQSYRRKYWEYLSADHDNDGLSWDEVMVEKLDTRVETLIDITEEHPGAGSFLILNCFPKVEPFVKLWQRLPIDQTSPKTAKKDCADRSYFSDCEGWFRSALRKRIVKGLRLDEDPVFEEENVIILPHMRFLHYSSVGSALAPHTDLSRVDQETGQRSTHSFLLYLTTCVNGSETTLLHDVSGPGREIVLSRVQPRLGALLLFPHDCPHEGNVVQDVPKLLIRGEIVLKL